MYSKCQLHFPTLPGGCLHPSLTPLLYISIRPVDILRQTLKTQKSLEADTLKFPSAASPALHETVVRLLFNKDFAALVQAVDEVMEAVDETLWDD